MIPYMMIEKIYASLCCQLFQNRYFNHLDVPVLIDYFTCHHGIGLFDNITGLINYFSVQQHPKINDDINRYHQIFFVWFSFYQYCSKK